MSGSSGPDTRQLYGEIIDLPHHRSVRHPPMSLSDRAAQFAPFAALTGYDEMVEEEARLTEREIHPGEEDLEHLDRQFRSLLALLSAGQKSPVSVLVFVPDPRKAGGRYETISGTAVRLDPVEKKLILRDGGSPPEEIVLDMDRILDLFLQP